jgi:hypothetical protein
METWQSAPGNSSLLSRTARTRIFSRVRARRKHNPNEPTHRTRLLKSKLHQRLDRIRSGRNVAIQHTQRKRTPRVALELCNQMHLGKKLIRHLDPASSIVAMRRGRSLGRQPQLHRPAVSPGFHLQGVLVGLVGAKHNDAVAENVIVVIVMMSVSRGAIVVRAMCCVRRMVTERDAMVKNDKHISGINYLTRPIAPTVTLYTSSGDPETQNVTTPRTSSPAK